MYVPLCVCVCVFLCVCPFSPPSYPAILWDRESPPPPPHDPPPPSPHPYPQAIARPSPWEEHFHLANASQVPTTMANDPPHGEEPTGGLRSSETRAPMYARAKGAASRTCRTLPSCSCERTLGLTQPLIHSITWLCRSTEDTHKLVLQRRPLGPHPKPGRTRDVRPFTQLASVGRCESSLLLSPCT